MSAAEQNRSVLHNRYLLVAGPLAALAVGAGALYHPVTNQFDGQPVPANTPEATSTIDADAQTPDVTETAPSVASPTPPPPAGKPGKQFKPEVVGCSATSTTSISLDTPFSVFVRLEKGGKPIKSKRDYFPAHIRGDITAYACLNSPRALRYSRKLTNQNNNTATWALDARKLECNLDMTQLSSTVTVHSKQEVFSELKKFKPKRATKADASNMLGAVLSSGDYISGMNHFTAWQHVRTEAADEIIGYCQEGVIQQYVNQAQAQEVDMNDFVIKIVRDNVTQGTLYKRPELPELPDDSKYYRRLSRSKISTTPIVQGESS